MNNRCRITSMTVMSSMYPHNYFCTLPVFDEQCFLDTDLYEFPLNIANRAFRTIGTKVHIKQYEECGYISNIYKSVL